MKRILIFGNSGSGKSWLAREISNRENLLEVNLDSIFWVPGGFSQKRTEKEVAQKIEDIKSRQSWVVEGVFGNLVSEFISQATEVIFLDFKWSECKRNLINRGSESAKQLDSNLAEVKFRELLEWASKYDSRESMNSYSFHNDLYSSFQGLKYRIKDREGVLSHLSSR